MTAPQLLVSAGLLLSTMACIPAQPQAAARGDPAWERLSLRQLYQERSP